LEPLHPDSRMPTNRSSIFLIVSRHCDCHAQVDTICSLIPKASPGNGVLSLCFLDPFDFSGKFDTIRRLASFYIDFLVLLAIGMDANRNYDHYVDGESTRIDAPRSARESRLGWTEGHSGRSISTPTIRAFSFWRGERPWSPTNRVSVVCKPSRHRQP